MILTVKMWCVIVLFIGFNSVAGYIDLSDAEHRLPRLFHVDDYARCLARPGALYCMGSFRLTPAISPHRVYDVMKDHSASNNAFDRTLLHRGYCVTSRCADASYNTTTPTDNAKRFEVCVQKWARPQQLTTRLETLHYCRSPDHRQLEIREALQENSMHQLLLKIVYTILTLNFVGTVYDLMLGDDVKKNTYLVSWSLRNNWRRLTADYNSNDRLTTLNPIQGIRVLLMLIVVLAHAGEINYMLYTYNPSYLEMMTRHPGMIIVRNGAAVIQVFMIISSFLMTYNLLLFSKGQGLTFAMLPKILLNRIARISPTSLLVILFAATWWPLLHDGPVWQLLASNESNICKNKFWSHVLFINNYVEPNSHCLIQTWYLAADMQLYIIAAILTLGIAQLRVKAEPLLKKLFVLACCINTVYAYIYEYKPFVYIMTPEGLRTTFKNEPSFGGAYTAAWSSIPTCILGVYLAHKHYREETEGKKIEHSYLFRMFYPWILPLIFAWMFVGSFVIDINSRLLAAVCVGIERPVFALLAAVKLYGFCKKIDHPLRTLFGWHGFRVLARLSLAVLMLHWCLDMLLSATRPMLTSTSLFVILAEGVATWVFTYILAIPLTLMVEMPAYRSVVGLLG